MAFPVLVYLCACEIVMDMLEHMQRVQHGSGADKNTSCNSDILEVGGLKACPVGNGTAQWQSCCTRVWMLLDWKLVFASRHSKEDY